jgi:hypothetical protein
MAFAAKTLKFYLLIWTLLIFENILAKDEFHPSAAVWSIRSRPFNFIQLYNRTTKFRTFSDFHPKIHREKREMVEWPKFPKWIFSFGVFG